jgi:spore germination cell wall hydrolase CwlJ-like protein
MELEQLAQQVKLMNEMREVAKTIAAEAASEGEEGMLAVANVINNRAVKKGKTPYEIITAKNQFYGTTASNRDRLYKEVQPIVDKLAQMLYNKQLKDNTNGAEYFRQPKESIRKWHGEETIRMGNHIFHKERVNK